MGAETKKNVRSVKNMKDRYLFKGKRIDNGEWIGGWLFELVEIPPPFIMMSKSLGESHEVDPTTICQCTGLKDKNGNMMYENDIVKRTDKPKAGEPTIGIIEYDIANTAFLIRWLDNLNYSPMYPWKEKIQIVGNKFDYKFDEGGTTSGEN